MSVFNYSGQWTGDSHGDPPGHIVLDLDIDPATQASIGIAYLYSPDPNSIPSAFAEVKINVSRKKFSVIANPRPFDARIGRILSLQDVATHFNDVTFPETVEIKFERVSCDKILVEWVTEIGTSGKVELERTRLPINSTRVSDPNVRSWNDFKIRVSTLNFRDCVFRGQSHPFPLQTTFHRSNRKVLPRYLKNDIPTLHRSITGRINHIFNLERPDEFGAMLNLAQHHGFPTPLLDWTYSPFVAAWFAFQKGTSGRKKGDSVRIYCLNREGFLRFSQFLNLTFTIPHISILDALAIENDRAIPQQGLLMLTNMQDVEAHIAKLEKSNNVALLTAYDLPIEDTKDAMNDLAMMGITRSTLMPGIESICLDMKDRLFS